MASTTSATCGELGTHRITMSLASATAAGDPPSIAPRATARSDRAGTPGRHGDLMARLEQVAGHGQSHGPEADEAELHGVLLSGVRASA